MDVCKSCRCPIRFRMPMVLIAVYQFQLPLNLGDIALLNASNYSREFISVLPKYE